MVRFRALLLSLLAVLALMSPSFAVGLHIPSDVLSMYAALPNERFPLPAARIDLVEPQFWRQVVPDPTGERPGTVVVDTANRYLYLVRDDGQAHALRRRHRPRRLRLVGPRP